MAKSADKVTVTIPKAPRGEDNFILVSVNGSMPAKIKRGVPVEVSPAIAEVIRNAEEAAVQADEYAEGTAR